MGKNKKTDQSVLIQNSRRRFLRNSGLVLASVGVSVTDRLEMLTQLDKSIFSSAYAEALTTKRMIFIGVRAGAPLIGIGTHGMFSQLNAPVVPNCPFAGNQLIKTGINNLYLTPASGVLQKHAENIAVTQGVINESGHTKLFDFWEGGSGAGKTSPIIELANRNTAYSVLPGVHFVNVMGGRAVDHRMNGLDDLLSVHESNFKNNFKKPTLLLTENEANRVIASAVSLSRRQALRVEQIVNNPVEVTNRHDRAAKLMNLDYQAALDISTMPSALTSGSGVYGTFGKSLAYTIKAMILNLINSSAIELDVKDWHGLRDTTLTVPYYQQVSQKIAATIDYLKATPEPSDASKTLWDTTVIVMGSEFTRVDRTFDQDNGDGGAQGIFLAGKNVRGGYYGEIQHIPSPNETDQILRFTGIDAKTGQSLPIGMKNSPIDVYNTINKLVGNLSDEQKVLHAMIKG